MLTKLNVNNGKEQDSPGEAPCSSVESQGQPQGSEWQDGPYPMGAPDPPRSAVGRRGGPGTHTAQGCAPTLWASCPRKSRHRSEPLLCPWEPTSPRTRTGHTQAGDFPGGSRVPSQSPAQHSQPLRLMSAGHRPFTPRVVRLPLWD